MTQWAHQRYLAHQVLTASPERLVTMLYDGIVADLGRASSAIAAGDSYACNEALVRAQSIVLELQRSLRTDVWDGADQLLAVYHFLYSRLVVANVKKDAAVVAECLALVQPLQQAWHRAYVAVGESRQAVAAS